MNEIKVGDNVRVTKGDNTKTVDWTGSHKEGEFKILTVTPLGNYQLSDGDCTLIYAQEWCELITPKTRLMNRREIMAKVCTMDKDNPFLVGNFESKSIADGANFSKWYYCGRYSFNDNTAMHYYYRHIHPITGEWTSEPSQFLIEERKVKSEKISMPLL